MSAPLPSCIVFDLDGTLIHSLPGIEHSIRAAFASCQIPIAGIDLHRIIGPPISEIIASVGNIQDEATLNSLVAAFRSNYDGEGWMKTELYPGVADVLDTLGSAGHRPFIVSNKPIHIALRILAHWKIDAYFEAILTRDSRSPAYVSKAEMLQALADAHRFDLKDAIVAGDTMEDADAAAETGAAFAFMAYGYGHIGTGACSPVAFRLDSFADILPLVARELVHDR